MRNITHTFIRLLLTHLKLIWQCGDHDLSQVRTQYVEKVRLITKGRKA